MDYSTTKKEEIEQLKMIYDNLCAIESKEKEIKEKKKENIDVEAEIDKFKKESKEIPKFLSSYNKLMAEYKKPKEKVLNILNKIYLTFYILLGIFLVAWTIFKIVSYCESGIFVAIVGYEVFLIIPWIIGGFILNLFFD